VLWTEPGAGTLVPRSAFADPAAEKAFVDAVRSHIASAQEKSGRWAEGAAATPVLGLLSGTM